MASVLIAEVDGRVAGMALWFPTFSTWIGKAGIWLEDLFVRPEFRGNGIGGDLLHQLRSMTDARVEWNVLDWNESAIGFYRSLGAEPVEGWTTYRWLPGHRALPPVGADRRPRCRRPPGSWSRTSCRRPEAWWSGSRSVARGAGLLGSSTPGPLAQLVRAPARHAGGQGFESRTAHRFLALPEAAGSRG